MHISYICTLEFINNFNKYNTAYGKKKGRKKTELCEKERTLLHRAKRSLFRSDLSRLACISLKSTHTNNKYGKQFSFFFC